MKEQEYLDHLLRNPSAFPPWIYVPTVVPQLLANGHRCSRCAANRWLPGAPNVVSFPHEASAGGYNDVAAGGGEAAGGICGGRVSHGDPAEWRWSREAAQIAKRQGGLRTAMPRAQA